jgi:hypothetical protein
MVDLGNKVLETYKQVGARYPCKIMDKDGNIKKIIYPKEMDLAAQEQINMHYNNKFYKYQKKGKIKPPTIEKEEANT